MTDHSDEDDKFQRVPKAPQLSLLSGDNAPPEPKVLREPRVIRSAQPANADTPVKPVKRLSTPPGSPLFSGQMPPLRRPPAAQQSVKAGPENLEGVKEPPPPLMQQPEPAAEENDDLKLSATVAPPLPTETLQSSPQHSEDRRIEDRRGMAERRDTPPTPSRREDIQSGQTAAPSTERTAVLPSSPQPARPKPSAPKPVLVADNEGLVVHSLGKQFKKRPVLRDVSLRVQRGEAVGLLGPNGAGKTTCFYIVTGLIPTDYGQIELDGVDITELPMYRRSRLGIGYLPQESSIFRGLTVEQNISAVLELIEKNREKREAALEALMAEFSITHLRRTPAVALSGGERRRLEIARALASQPNFVLLDEPLAGIDPIAVRDIRELVSHLKDRGIGVLITDHNVRETLDIVDRAYILHDGHVLMEGTPAEIVENQEVRRVYLGDRFSL